MSGTSGSDGFHSKGMSGTSGSDDGFHSKGMSSTSGVVLSSFVGKGSSSSNS